MFVSISVSLIRIGIGLDRILLYLLGIVLLIITLSVNYLRYKNSIYNRLVELTFSKGVLALNTDNQNYSLEFYYKENVVIINTKDLPNHYNDKIVESLLNVLKVYRDDLIVLQPKEENKLEYLLIDSDSLEKTGHTVTINELHILFGWSIQQRATIVKETLKREKVDL